MREVVVSATAVAAAAAVTVLGGGQAAATVLDGQRAAAAPATLPEGFLLHEAKASGPSRPWERMRLTDSLRTPLEVNPCDRGPVRDGRRASRTFTYTAETVYRSEQVVVYRSPGAAEEAMAGLRADLRRCAAGGSGPDRYAYRWKSTGIGDEALRIGGFFFENRFRYVVVRKGSALAVYVRTGLVTKSLPAAQFRPLLQEARTMAGKLCDLPRVCR